MHARLRTVTFLGVAAMIVCPAHALEQKKPTHRDAKKVLCKSDADTGSRFKTRRCYTAEEWDQIAEVAKRDEGERVFRKPRGGRD